MVEINEKAQIYRISLLSSRMSQIITDILEKRIVVTQGTDEFRIIERAREFLSQCISGGEFASGGSGVTGFISSFENLKAYNLVMPTFSEDQRNDAIQILSKMEKALEHIQFHPNDITKKKSEIDKTKLIFSLLADAMYQRVQEMNYYKPSLEINAHAELQTSS